LPGELVKRPFVLLGSNKEDDQACGAKAFLTLVQHAKDLKAVHGHIIPHLLQQLKSAEHKVQAASALALSELIKHG